MKEAKKLTTDLDSALETGGFQIKGWVSNRIEETENRQQEVSPKGITVEKVLGVVWISERDTLSFKVPADFPEGKEMVQLSKRKILSRVAQVYDPIGYATAFLIKAKIGLQTLWKRGISWDEDLPPDLLEKWKTLFEEMVQFNGVSFERCLTPPVVAKQDLFLNSNNRDQLRVRSPYASELSTSDSLNKKITRELEEKTELQTLN